MVHNTMGYSSESFGASCGRCKWETREPKDTMAAFTAAREHDREQHAGKRVAKAIVPVPPE